MAVEGGKTAGEEWWPGDTVQRLLFKVKTGGKTLQSFFRMSAMEK